MLKEILYVFGETFKIFFNLMLKLFPVVSELNDLPAKLFCAALGIPFCVITIIGVSKTFISLIRRFG